MLRNKIYKVINKEKYIYGVFPFTIKGKKQAKKYADKLNKQTSKILHKKVKIYSVI